MGYPNAIGDAKNLITTLRDTGFDVIIVNQPNYVRNGVKIDGGADFIERNAMNLASLLKKLNQTLLANNSNNKIVIVGPSMGGQISRYALAWMEKKFAETGLAQYNHNTRLWVAFDSPNLGSNVPLGDQALINLLSEDSTDAETKYKEYLGSTASKELLIEYHQQASNNVSAVINSNLNGQTTTMGMLNNSGNQYFQTHYNNQSNNGLPNSKGYPMNLRKIAIVNGSLSGVTTGNNSEKILDIRAIQSVCFQPFSVWGWSPSICNTIKLADIQSYNMPSSGGYSKVAYYDKIIGAGKHTNASNLNIRGNMDTVPGGLYGATNDIATGITGVPVFPMGGLFQIGMNLKWLLSTAIGGANWSVRTLKQFHTFIPTFSALGIKNPNQSWSSPLNRNLVCSNETIFDSYFGEAANTEHTLLNYKSVDWFLKELETSPLNPQAPYFPLQDNLLTGASTVCLESNTTISFGDICKLPSAVTWSVTPNIQIITPNSYNVVLKGLTGGAGTITATFQNGQTVIKNVWVGRPSLPKLLTYSNIPYDSTLQTGPSFNPIWQYSTFDSQDNVQGYSFKDLENNVLLTKYGNTINVTANELGIGYGGTLSYYVYPINACGEINILKKSLLKSTIYYPTLCQYGIGQGCGIQRPSANSNIAFFYKIYPNPTANIVNIELKSEDQKPNLNAIIISELYNMMGEVKRNVSITNNLASIDVLGLPRGIYLLKINIDGVVESHQVGVE